MVTRPALYHARFRARIVIERLRFSSFDSFYPVRNNAPLLYGGVTFQNNSVGV